MYDVNLLHDELGTGYFDHGFLYFFYTFFIKQQLNYWVIGLVCYEKRPAVPRKGERPINQLIN